MEKFDFATTSLGPERDFVELYLWPPSQGHSGRQLALWSDLRFGDQDFSVVGWDVTARFKRAELKATLTGCELQKGTILGDTPQAHSWVVHESEVKDKATQQSGKASALLAAGTADGISAHAELGGAIEGQAHTTTSQTREEQLLRRRISALPHLRWEISEPTGGLKGTYLRAPPDDENMTNDSSFVGPLLKLNITSDSFEVRADVRAKDDEIEIGIRPLQPSRLIWNAKSRPNKTAIVKMLIVAAASGDPSGGERKLYASCSLSGALQFPALDNDSVP